VRFVLKLFSAFLRRSASQLWCNSKACVEILCRFRAAPDSDRHLDSVSPKKAKSDRRRHTSSSKSHRSGSGELSDLGQTDGVSPLTAFLTPTLPPGVTIKDPSLEVLALLRVIHGLNRHWSSLYDVCFILCRLASFAILFRCICSEKFTKTQILTAFLP
jgi:hypothetical protein